MMLAKEPVKVFLSQPMRDKTAAEIKQQRAHIEIYLKSKLKEPFEILDTFFDYKEEKGNTPLRYLSRSLEMLASADLAVFTRDYDKARGCKIEYECAKRYGIPILIL